MIGIVHICLTGQSVCSGQSSVSTRCLIEWPTIDASPSPTYDDYDVECTLYGCHE